MARPFRPLGGEADGPFCWLRHERSRLDRASVQVVS